MSGARLRATVVAAVALLRAAIPLMALRPTVPAALAVLQREAAPCQGTETKVDPVASGWVTCQSVRAVATTMQLELVGTDGIALWVQQEMPCRYTHQASTTGRTPSR